MSGEGKVQHAPGMRAHFGLRVLKAGSLGKVLGKDLN